MEGESQASQELAGVHWTSSPSTGLWNSAYLLKPGLMRDSPGIFRLADKAEPAALFFLGLGSASVRDRKDRESKGQLVALAALQAPLCPGCASRSHG